jgi:hypothetical protein
MNRGEKWLCSNEGCGAEIVVTESSQFNGIEKPRCGCGSTMKRSYEKPSVRKRITAEGSLTSHLDRH